MAMDRPMLDSRYENHAWGDQFNRCVIWQSGLVTSYERAGSPAVGRRLASDKVIADVGSTQLEAIHRLIKLATRGNITDPEDAADDAGVRSFSAWEFVDYDPMFEDFLLMQWGDESRINKSDAASELVDLMIEIFRETDCPGAEFGRPQGSGLDPRSRQDVLGENWNEADAWPNRKWSTTAFQAEVGHYRLPGGYDLMDSGGAARTILSPFIGLMDGPFSTPTESYWDGPDPIAAGPRVRRIVADGLAEALTGQSEAWDFGHHVFQMQIERQGGWLCDVAEGCYPEGLIIATRPMEVDEAKALCQRLHDMDKVCAVVIAAR